MPPTFDHQTGQISAFVSRGERTLARGGQRCRKSRSVRATVFGFAKFPVLESRREADGYARHGEERTNLSFLSVLNS